MSDHDPTRSAAPVPPTVSHAPDALTPSYQPANATVERTPAQDAARAEELGAPPDVPGYDTLGPLGEGGMALVFRARERAFNRDVAIKVLKAKYRLGSPGARRFLEEANVTAQLQHPAIPPVHQIGELADGRPFLAMKLIKGDTLADLLSADGVVRSRFVPAFAQVCHAVAYAHSRKVIHRDLKPANIMVGAFGEVLVMDWGLAKVLGAPEAAPVEAEACEATEIRTGREPDSATQAGSVLGTPSYMAPEQAAGEVERIDERADVFGLGAVLCTILTGKPPYDGPSTESVRLKAIRGETDAAFARLDACGADAELIALCKRCLSAERDARPRNASEVARAVSAHLSAVEERAKQAELERVRTEERRKQRRVQWVLVGVVLLLLAAGAVGAGFAHLWRAAESARDTADERRAEAERLRGEAERAKTQVEFERDRAAAFEHGATMRVAHQEWRDGNLIAMGALLDGTDPKCRGWEWNYLNRLHDPSLLALKGHNAQVNAASFSANGTRIVTASSDYTAKVWDANSGSELLTLKGHTSIVSSASFSADGTRIVTASLDETAKVWEVLSGKSESTAKSGAEVLTLKGHKASVSSASFSADGTRIVTASGDNTAKVWDARSGTEVLTLKGHVSGVSSASFSADGTRVVTASWDETAKVWDAKSGAEVLTLKGHTDNVWSASFSADGTRIVTASGDNTAKVWDARSGTEVLTLKGHGNRVDAASFSADGTRVVTASWDRTAKVWDANSGAEVLTLKGHTGFVHSASFSADGTRIVTASRDQTAKVWDAKSGAELLTLKGHTYVVLAASFSADGTRIVTANGGNTAKVWDAKRGVEVLTLKGHTNSVSSASFSADGTRIVTASDNGTAKVWDSRPVRDSVPLPPPLPVAPAPRAK